MKPNEYQIEKMKSPDYSAKPDELAMSVLSSNIKPTTRKVFEGFMSKIEWRDFQAILDEDAPLTARFTVKEFRENFVSSESNRTTKEILGFFDEAREYYIGASLKVLTETEHRSISIADKIEVNKTEQYMEILFSRSIITIFKEAQEKWFFMELGEYGSLQSKYALKLFEVFTALLTKSDTPQMVVYRHRLSFFAKLMSFPASINNSPSQAAAKVFVPSVAEINEKTSLNVTFEKIKNPDDKKDPFFEFTITTKDNSALDEKARLTTDPMPEDVAEEIDYLLEQYEAKGLTRRALIRLYRAKNKKDPEFGGPELGGLVDSLHSISEYPTTLNLVECVNLMINNDWRAKGEYFEAPENHPKIVKVKRAEARERNRKLKELEEQRLAPPSPNNREQAKKHLSEARSKIH